MRLTATGARPSGRFNVQNHADATVDFLAGNAEAA
jgi:hypothetical protein